MQPSDQERLDGALRHAEYLQQMLDISDAQLRLQNSELELLRKAVGVEVVVEVVGSVTPASSPVDEEQRPTTPSSDGYTLQLSGQGNHLTIVCDGTETLVREALRALAEISLEGWPSFVLYARERIRVLHRRERQRRQTAGEKNSAGEA